MSDMTASDSGRDRQLEKLLAHACDDLLDTSEAAALAARLQNEPKTRRAYLEALCIESLLKAEHEDSLLSLANAERAALLSKPRAGFKLWDERSYRADAYGRWRLATLTGLAASLLVMTAGVHLWTWKYHDHRTLNAQRATIVDGMPVGRVADLKSVRWEATMLDEADPLVGGQILKIVEGTATFELDGGTRMTVVGPAELEVVSKTLVTARRGVYRAVSYRDDEQFVMQTPTMQLVKPAVDLGNWNTGGAGVGVEIADSGATDVVVFDGEVSLQVLDGSIINPREKASQEISFRARRSVRRLGMGQALHVGRSGQVERIVTLDNSRFPSNDEVTPPLKAGIIRRVSDDMRRSNSPYYYEIVRGGFQEDARAFVDRFHQWNSIDDRGLPEELREADYVLTFNGDKWSDALSIEVELAGAARLYVFADDRVPTPDWLNEQFADTGLDIGLDEGWQSPNGLGATLSRKGDLVPIETTGAPQAFSYSTSAGSAYLSGVGPGESVDAIYSVWQLDVPEAGWVRLGPAGPPNERTSMYGIAAVPLQSVSKGSTD